MNSEKRFLQPFKHGFLFHAVGKLICLGFDRGNRSPWIGSGGYVGGTFERRQIRVDSCPCGRIREFPLEEVDRRDSEYPFIVSGGFLNALAQFRLRAGGIA